MERRPGGALRPEHRPVAGMEAAWPAIEERQRPAGGSHARANRSCGRLIARHDAIVYFRGRQRHFALQHVELDQRLLALERVAPAAATCGVYAYQRPGGDGLVVD